MVTAVSGSGDAAAVVTLESPAGTILWRQRFTGAFSFSTPGVVIPGAAGQNVLLKISASTSNCEANLSGYDV